MELKQAPSGPTTKKNMGAPDPLRGRYGGSKFQLPPLPPQIPFVRYRKSSGYGPGSSPATIREILVNLRATQPEIFSLSYGPPAPGIYRGQKPINRSQFICWILLHTHHAHTPHDSIGRRLHSIARQKRSKGYRLASSVLQSAVPV